MNLGFGDAEALAAVLRERGPVADAGAADAARALCAPPRGPVLAMQAVTDGLCAALRRCALRGCGRLRNRGMRAVDRPPLAKRLLAQPALR